MLGWSCGSLLGHQIGPLAASRPELGHRASRKMTFFSRFDYPHARLIMQMEVEHSTIVKLCVVAEKGPPACGPRS